MSLPINRSAKATLDANLVNGITSDAPALKASDDVVYNTIDELYNYALSLVTSGTLSPYPPGDYNNLINGNFAEWRRGTTFNFINSDYSADGWYISNNADSNIKVYQSDLKLRIEEYDSVGSVGAYTNIEQSIENYMDFAGKVVTFSANLILDPGVSYKLLIIDGASGGSVSSGDITSSGIYSVTYTVPSNPSYLRPQIQINRSSLAVGLGMSVDWAKLAPSVSETPFMPKNPAEELAACQRSYETSYNDGNYPGDTNVFQGALAYPTYLASGTNRLYIPFKQSKRVVPTVKLYNPLTGEENLFCDGGTSTYSVVDVSVNGFCMYPTTSYVIGADIRFHYVADAEEL